jgi:hypothetical protein
MNFTFPISFYCFEVLTQATLGLLQKVFQNFHETTWEKYFFHGSLSVRQSNEKKTSSTFRAFFIAQNEAIKTCFSHVETTIFSLHSFDIEIPSYSPGKKQLAWRTSERMLLKSN